MQQPIVSRGVEAKNASCLEVHEILWPKPDVFGMRLNVLFVCHGRFLQKR